MEKQLSVYNVVNGDIELNNEQKDSLITLLCRGCRERTKRLIISRVKYGLHSVELCGILRRLLIDGNDVSYCAGQSYSDELRIVRNLFK